MQLRPVSSDLIQNMSCRARTTVNSRGMDKKILPPNLTGSVTNLSLNNFHRDKIITETDDPIPLIYAMLKLGVDKKYLDYMEFIEGCEDIHAKLLSLINEPPREIQNCNLPAVGVVFQFRDKSFRKFGEKPSLLAAVYMMSRCGESVFIRDKNPLLSRLSFSREIAVMFLGGK
jgi:hypothetical protein